MGEVHVQFDVQTRCRTRLYHMGAGGGAGHGMMHLPNFNLYCYSRINVGLIAHPPSIFVQLLTALCPLMNFHVMTLSIVEAESFATTNNEWADLDCFNEAL